MYFHCKKVQLPTGLSGILNQNQFNFTLFNITNNMPASIQIQGNLLNTSFNSILEQSPRLGNLASKSAAYIKQSVDLNANQSPSSNLVSWNNFFISKTQKVKIFSSIRPEKLLSFIMLEMVFQEMIYPQIVRLGHSVIIILPINVQINLASTGEHVLWDIMMRLIAYVPLAS
jgi:hypothetical protein